MTDMKVERGPVEWAEREVATAMAYWRAQIEYDSWLADYAALHFPEDCKFWEQAMAIAQGTPRARELLEVVTLAIEDYERAKRGLLP